jgi:hypothetical protein
MKDSLSYKFGDTLKNLLNSIEYFIMSGIFMNT